MCHGDLLGVSITPAPSDNLFLVAFTRGPVCVTRSLCEGAGFNSDPATLRTPPPPRTHKHQNSLMSPKTAQEKGPTWTDRVGGLGGGGGHRSSGCSRLQGIKKVLLLLDLAQLQLLPQTRKRITTRRGSKKNLLTSLRRVTATHLQTQHTALF